MELDETSPRKRKEYDDLWSEDESDGNIKKPKKSENGKHTKTDAEEGEITDPSLPQITTSSSSENQPQVAPQVDKGLDVKPKSNKSDKKEKDDKHKHRSSKDKSDKDKSHRDRSRSDKDRSSKSDKHRDRSRDDKDKKRDDRDRYDRDKREKEDRERRDRKDRYDRDKQDKEKRDKRNKEKNEKEQPSKTPTPAPETQVKVDKEDPEEFRRRVEAQMTKIEQDNEEEALKKSRERRLAILQKYKQDKVSQENQSTSQQPTGSAQEQPTLPKTPPQVVTPATPPPVETSVTTTTTPTEKADMFDYEQKDEEFFLSKFNNNNEVSSGTGETVDESDAANFEELEQRKRDHPIYRKEKGETDIFSDSPIEETKPVVKETKEFDMFSDSPGQTQKAVPLEKGTLATVVTEATDDSEGYYCYRIGEVLNGKYAVMGSFGKGVFSTVIRGKQITTDRDVAIKILRNNEAMKRMGYKEVQLLRDLEAADPENKYHCIRLLDHFEDRDHLCLVFEPMLGGNLREVLKKYGTKIGLSIKAVRIYARQMLLALRHLKKCKVLHADIKLDNILVNEQKTSIKMGDFGSASTVTENAITPYLVSRFYRAPEIIIGLNYSYPLDMWSVGCCIYEIYTGKILFPGRTNNDMLYRCMEISGPFPKKMLKKGEFVSMHFDEQFNFKRVVKDKITNKELTQITPITKPIRDLKNELLNSPYELTQEEKRMVLLLHDLLSKIFTLDPNQRISPEDALKHPFILEK